MRVDTVGAAVPDAPGRPAGRLATGRTPAARTRQPGAIGLGLGANWRQFALLVVVNAFVGALVGLERSILSLLAEREFGLASRAAILSFLITFGVCKAAANYAAGRLSDRVGRKPVLVTGWLVALPAPVMVIFAPSWEWVVAANVLVGINQGLAWSTTVIMKIDLAGPARRGLAMGLNVAAGYLAAAGAALVAGYLAASFGPRPVPFVVGLALAVIGDVAHPSWRAQSLGVYRLWRDAGYAIGALSAGMLADRFGLAPAIAATAAVTAASGAVVAARMRETHRGAPAQ